MSKLLRGRPASVKLKGGDGPFVFIKPRKGALFVCSGRKRPREEKGFRDSAPEFGGC